MSTRKPTGTGGLTNEQAQVVLAEIGNALIALADQVRAGIGIRPIERPKLVAIDGGKDA